MVVVMVMIITVVGIDSNSGSCAGIDGCSCDSLVITNSCGDDYGDSSDDHCHGVDYVIVVIMLVVTVTDSDSCSGSGVGAVLVVTVVLVVVILVLVVTHDYKGWW